MNLKELNNLILLKRFREQFLFGLFDGLDIEGEVLDRMAKAGAKDDQQLVALWVDQLRNGRRLKDDFKAVILLRMSGI